MEKKSSYDIDPYVLDVDERVRTISVLLAELKSARDVIGSLEEALVIVIKELKIAREKK